MNTDIQVAHTLQEAGQVANHYASMGTFDRHRAKLSDNTLKAHDQDLASFAEFLTATGTLFGDPLEVGSWAGMTWGIADAYKLWMIEQGLAISTVNRRLSTIKVYAGLAHQAGEISGDDFRLLETVKGYSKTAAKKVNAKRSVTRVSNKKATPVRFTDEQVNTMIAYTVDGTAQGRRDRVLLTMLFRQGLRAGELAGLTVDNIDIGQEQMTFYRQKVDKTQTHDLHPDTVAALRDYIDSGDCPKDGLLLRGSRKGGKLTGKGMSEINITKRVGVLADAIDVVGASAHDARHWWATHYARKGVDVFTLQEAGGWSSLEMPRRYVEDAKVANGGMVK